MTDIASFGFAIDSSQVVQAAANLRDMAAASSASQKQASELLSVVKQQQSAIDQAVRQQQVLIDLQRAQSAQQHDAATGWRATTSAIAAAVTAASTGALAFKGLTTSNRDLAASSTDVVNAARASGQHMDALTEKARQLTMATQQAAAAQRALGPNLLRGDLSGSSIAYGNATGAFAQYVSNNASSNPIDALARAAIPLYDAARRGAQASGQYIDRFSSAYGFSTDQYARDTRASVSASRDLAFTSGTSAQSAASFRQLNDAIGLDPATANSSFDRLSHILSGVDDASGKARLSIERLGVSIKDIGPDQAGRTIVELARQINALPDGIYKSQKAVELLGTSDRSVLTKLANPNAYSIDEEDENARRQVGIDGDLQRVQLLRDTRVTNLAYETRRKDALRVRAGQVSTINDATDSQSHEYYADGTIGASDRFSDYAQNGIDGVVNAFKYANDPGRAYETYSFQADPLRAAADRARRFSAYTTLSPDGYGTAPDVAPAPAGMASGASYFEKLLTSISSAFGNGVTGANGDVSISGSPQRFPATGPFARASYGDDAASRALKALDDAQNKHASESGTDLSGALTKLVDGLTPGNRALIEAATARNNLEKGFQNLYDDLTKITDSTGAHPFALDPDSIKDFANKARVSLFPQTNPQEFQGGVAFSRSAALSGRQGYQRELADRLFQDRLNKGGGGYENYQIPDSERQGITDQVRYGRLTSAQDEAVVSENQLGFTQAGLSAAVGGGNQFDVQRAITNSHFDSLVGQAGSPEERLALNRERDASISSSVVGQDTGNQVQRNYQGALTKGFGSLPGAAAQGPVALRSALLRAQGGASASAGAGDNSDLEIQRASDQSLAQGKLQFFNTDADIKSTQALTAATKDGIAAVNEAVAKEGALVQLRQGLIEKTDVAAVSTQLLAKHYADLNKQTADQNLLLTQQASHASGDQSAALAGPAPLRRQQLEDQISDAFAKDPTAKPGDGGTTDTNANLSRAALTNSISLSGAQQIQSGQQGNDQLVKQISLLNESAQARSKDLAVYEAQIQATNSGADEKQTADLVKLAAARADATNVLEQYQKQQGVIDQTTGKTGDDIEKMILHVNAAKSAASDLFQSIADALLKMALINPLQNFMQQGIGSAMGSLFGDPSMSGNGLAGGTNGLGMFSGLAQSLGFGGQSFDASSLTAANGFTASTFSSGLSDSAVDLSLGFADGGVFYNGSLQRFATGGVVGSPTYFPMAGGNTGLMGEAGPEAIVPLTRDSNGKLGIKGGGGVNFTPNIQINMNASGGSTAQNKDMANQVSTQVHAQLTSFVQTQLRNETRPGGVIYQAVNG